MSFVETPSLELRQGDICGIDAFPYWDLNSTGVQQTGDDTKLVLPTWDRVIEREGPRLVAICSHDCDIENPDRRTGLLIAPLIPVPASPLKEAERYAEIVNSDKDVDNEFSYIHLFPMTLGGSDTVVDFSALIHYARAQHTVVELLGRKIAELTDDTRSRFRLKLGSFFGRL